MRKNEKMKKHEKNMEAVQMKKNEKMSIAITQFILDNDFLVRFIVDNVSEKIYTEKQYNTDMVYDVVVNDLDNCYNNSYLMDTINEEIDVHEIVDEINKNYEHIFIMLAKECNNRYN